MNNHLDITKATKTPVSRRDFIAMAAVGSATLPAAALAETNENLSFEEDARLAVERQLLDLIEAHKVARAALDASTDEIDSVALGHPPTKAAEWRWRRDERAEAAAINAIVAYVPWNDPSRRMKANYLLRFVVVGELDGGQMAHLLISMCGRCA